MSDDDDDCPFDILDLPESANENDITQRWKKLMLKNHPDKTSDPNSDKIAQRLNDAKDRAITIFRQNKKIADHVEELKGHTKTELMSNSKYSRSISMKVMAMQTALALEMGSHRLIDAFIGGYYRLVNHLKERISTLEDSIEEQKAKAKQTEEQKTSKINTMISNLNALQEELEVERSMNEEISTAINELTRERDTAVLEIEKLKRERDDAISNANMLKSERDDAMLQVEKLKQEKEIGITLSEQTEHQHEIQSTLHHEEDIEEIAYTTTSKHKFRKRKNANDPTQTEHEGPDGKSMARKHRKVFSSSEEEAAFKQYLNMFLLNNFQSAPDKSKFISKRNIKIRFDLEWKSDGNINPITDNLFFKELGRQMGNTKFSDTVSPERRANVSGFAGLISTT